MIIHVCDICDMCMWFYVLFVFFYLLFVCFCVLFVCKCVLYYCHQVVTQLQLNISYHIAYHIIYHNISYHLSYHIVSYHILCWRKGLWHIWALSTAVSRQHAHNIILRDNFLKLSFQLRLHLSSDLSPCDFQERYF